MVTIDDRRVHDESFITLDIGDPFYHHGELYWKTNKIDSEHFPKDITFNAINIATGHTITVERYEHVVPVDAKIIITDYTWEDEDDCN